MLRSPNVIKNTINITVDTQRVNHIVTAVLEDIKTSLTGRQQGISNVIENIRVV